ncbi:hypothetical protein HCU40_05750 [Pseudanabaena biceps]|nr:hypothetical protein [Pseudanabaena biceps]
MTQISLKSQFRAIWTTLLGAEPQTYADRFAKLTQVVFDDSLKNLQSNLQPFDHIDLTVIAIAIGAYWHQDLQQVRSRLLELQSHSNADIQEIVLAYAIALSCRHEFKPRSFISQICHDFSQRGSLGRNATSPQFCLSQLRLAQKFVDQGTSAISAHQSLDQNDVLLEPIASSLYYFLSSPHSWHLITERAQRHPLKQYQPVVTMQVSAIAAAFLGDRVVMKYEQEIVTEGKRLGDRLWQEWAGVFNVATN